MTTYALLPAAGRSQRMGRPKLALALGEKTVLEHVVETVRRGGVMKVLVVLGPHVAFLAEAAERSGAAALILPQETAHMRATVELGVEWIQTHWQPSSDDALLLVPADHPTLNPNVIISLAQSLTQNPQAVLAIPTHQGQRGHPALIRWRCTEELARFPADKGINLYFRSLESATILLPWDGPEVLLDLDTPEDYQRLVASFEDRK